MWQLKSHHVTTNMVHSYCLHLLIQRLQVLLFIDSIENLLGMFSFIFNLNKSTKIFFNIIPVPILHFLLEVLQVEIISRFQLKSWKEKKKQTSISNSHMYANLKSAYVPN